jgi:hypothetical protein
MSLLAAVYGGVDEQVLLRLGVMTFLAWGLSRLGGRRAGVPHWLMWLSIVGGSCTCWHPCWSDAPDHDDHGHAGWRDPAAATSSGLRYAGDQLRARGSAPGLYRA